MVKISSLIVSCASVCARGWGPVPRRSQSSHASLQLRHCGTLHHVCLRAVRDGYAILVPVPYACAPCLRGLAGIGRVFYGCGNDKFGGNGSVLSLNTHAYVSSTAQRCWRCMIVMQCCRHLEPPHHTYPSRGGLFAEEAVGLLRRFYERGNVRGACWWSYDRCRPV